MCPPAAAAATASDGNHSHSHEKHTDYSVDIKPHPEVQKLNSELVELRRHFHSTPELSFEEHETAKYVASKLREYGVDEVHEGIGRTGVVGLIYGKDGKKGRCIAIRADMDGLPVLESEHKRNAGFCSKNKGKMHACGHDGHMAILLTATKVLCNTRSQWSGVVKLFFQPAEEGLGGAKEMIKDGCMGENEKLGPKVDEVYGLHLWTYSPTGTVDVEVGPMMAASDRFELTVHGLGGHGAIPEGTCDSIVAGAYLITQLQTVVSRNVSPLDSAVITVGEVKGGYNYNIIADKMEIVGTVRSYRPKTKALVERRMREICKGVETAYNVNIDFVYKHGYPATINHTDEGVSAIKAAAKDIVNPLAIRKPEGTMGAEDMSYFLNAQPHSAFFFVGANPTNHPDEMQKYPHHKSDFDIDEKSLLVGASVWVKLVHESLPAK